MNPAPAVTEKSPRSHSAVANGTGARQARGATTAVFRVSVLMLIAVPLAFTTAVHRIFALPRFAVLLLGSAVVAALLPLCWSALGRPSPIRMLSRSRLFILVSGYLICIGVSTIRGTEPMASLLGSYENQMGLITRLCFFACFLGLVLGTTQGSGRVEAILWAITGAGLIVACYGAAQFFGLDPFIDARLYTYQAASGRVLRIISTMGHAD